MSNSAKPDPKPGAAQGLSADDSESMRRVAREQREYWNGKAGQRWAQSQPAIDQAFEAYGDAALRRLSPRPGERILDIGCGSGASTLQLAKAVSSSGEVIGIDVSSPLLEVARRRLSQHPQAHFVQADAASYRQPTGQLCNALFSRFGVMFFAEPVAAFASLGRCLEPGGRLCFVCWQAPENNQWLTRIASSVAEALEEEPFALPPVSTRPGEFAFADPDYMRQILEQAGFSQVEIEAIELPVVLSRSGVEEAISFAMRVGPLAAKIAEHTPARIARIRERIQRLLSAVAEQELVQLPGAAWLASAVRG